MEQLILGIVRFVAALWDADQRPEARKLSIGVGIVLIALVLALWWWLR